MKRGVLLSPQQNMNSKSSQKDASAMPKADANVNCSKLTIAVANLKIEPFSDAHNEEMKEMKRVVASVDSTHKINLLKKDSGYERKSSGEKENEVTKLEEFHKNETIMAVKLRQIRRPLTILIEGNMASGKSSLLDKLATNKWIQTIPEPVDKWMNLHGNNTVQLMFDDPRRWGMMFQSYVQLTMLKAHHSKANPNCVLKVIERSLFSGQHCFARNLHEKGLITDVEYAVLNEWFLWITKNNEIQVDLIVYLRTSPEVAFDRKVKRGRKEESSVDLAYLETIHCLHERWLIKKEFPVPSPILTVDADSKNENELYSIVLDYLNGLLNQS